MTKAMFEKQMQAPSNTDLKIYPNRSHWTGIQPGWEEVVDFALDWAAKTPRPPLSGRWRPPGYPEDRQDLIHWQCGAEFSGD